MATIDIEPDPPMPEWAVTNPLALMVCPACDYDLRAAPPVGICPECGRAYDQETVYLHGRPRGGNRGRRLMTDLLANFGWIAVYFGLSMIRRLSGWVWVPMIAVSLVWAWLRRLDSPRYGTIRVRLNERGVAQYEPPDPASIAAIASAAAPVMLWIVFASCGAVALFTHKIVIAWILIAVAATLGAMQLTLALKLRGRAARAISA